MSRWLVLFALLTASCQVLADTRYVVDELVITVRSGRSNSHQIVKLLHSGAKIDVLSEIEEDGKQYAFIQAGDVTGWVLSQYLDTQPIARDRIAAIEAKAEKTRLENARLRKQLASLQEEKNNLVAQRDKLNRSAQKLDEELSKVKRVTARPLAIEKNNEKLRQDLAEKLSEVKLLREENARLKDREQRDWFLAGGGVVFVSILFGIIITRIRWRRRSSWGSSF